MARFAEVLDKVQSFLTWAPPADIQALLDGLVAEQVISEGYRQNLKLWRFHEEVPGKPGDWELIGILGSKVSTTLDQSEKEINGSSVGDLLLPGSSGDLKDIVGSMRILHSSNPKLMQELMEEKEKHLNSLNHVFHPTLANYQHSLRFSEEIQELLSGEESVQKPGNDSERIKKGNSQNGEEWLEQVEEAARRIAVPLWQNWQKGQDMLLSLISSATTGCAISDSMVSDWSGQHSLLDMEEETELEAAKFECTLLGITDPCLSNALDLQFGEFYSPAAGLNIDTCELEDEEGTASPVEACQAAETNDIIDSPRVLSLADRTTGVMNDHLSLKDVKRRTTHTLSESVCGDLLYLLKDFENTIKDNPYSDPGISESLDCCRNECNAPSCCTVRATSESVKLYQGKFMLNGLKNEAS